MCLKYHWRWMIALSFRYSKLKYACSLSKSQSRILEASGYNFSTRTYKLGLWDFILVLLMYVYMYIIHHMWHFVDICFWRVNVISFTVNEYKWHIVIRFVKYKITELILYLLKFFLEDLNCFWAGRNFVKIRQFW